MCLILILKYVFSVFNMIKNVVLEMLQVLSKISVKQVLNKKIVFVSLLII